MIIAVWGTSRGGSDAKPRGSLVLTAQMLERGAEALRGVAGSLVDESGWDDHTLVATILAASLGFEHWRIEPGAPLTEQELPASNPTLI